MNKIYPWQDELWQRWTGLRSRLPHALLLKGSQGIGKFDFAMRLAQSVLCEAILPDGMACNSCPSCHWFSQETHPDFRLLQPDALSEADDSGESGKKASRQISVDQVRALSDFYNLSSHRGEYRVVVVHPAEAMNANAANALLKTLEEPAGKILFILVSHKPQQLLPTILSRCLVLSAPAPSHAASITWLKEQGISKPEALLAQTGFAPLLALQLQEDMAGERERFLNEIGMAAQMDPLVLAEEFQRTEPVLLIHWLQQWCYDLASEKFARKVRYNTDMVDKIKNISSVVNPNALLAYQKELLTAKREAYHPLNPKLLFESLLLSYRRMAQP